MKHVMKLYDFGLVTRKLWQLVAIYLNERGFLNNSFFSIRLSLSWSRRRYTKASANSVDKTEHTVRRSSNKHMKNCHSTVAIYVSSDGKKRKTRTFSAKVAPENGHTFS